MSEKRVSGVDGSVINESSYNVSKILLQQKGDNDLWKAQVAMTDGDSCQGTLSAVTLGLNTLMQLILARILYQGVQWVRQLLLMMMLRETGNSLRFGEIYKCT